MTRTVARRDRDPAQLCRAARRGKRLAPAAHVVRRGCAPHCLEHEPHAPAHPHHRRCWAVSTTFLAIAFGYICLTAHIDFSGREGLCIVGIAASSLLSCGIGAWWARCPDVWDQTRAGASSRR